MDNNLRLAVVLSYLRNPIELERKIINDQNLNVLANVLNIVWGR